MPDPLPDNESIFRGDADTKSPLSSSSHQGRKRVEVPYDNLVIVVELTLSGQFIGISEIRIRRDFLSNPQRVAASGFHDVDEFYKE